MGVVKGKPAIRTVLDKVRASLERAGFLRDGPILRRQGPGLSQVLNARTAAGCLDLTLGVYLPEVAVAHDGGVVDDPVFAHLNFSLADFVSRDGPTAGGSHLVAVKDASDVGRVIGLLESEALPFLEDISCRPWLLQNLWRHTVSAELARARQEVIRANLGTGLRFGVGQEALKFRPIPLIYPTPRHICEAAILCASGDSPAAKRVLTEAYAEALKYHPPHARHLLVVASRLGIEIAIAAEQAVAADGGAAGTSCRIEPSTRRRPRC